jgi:hypothetical protein
MTGIDRLAPLEFMRTAYHPDDWVAIFLKSYETRQTAQRVGPIALVASRPFQAWLRRQNATTANVYVSVNAVAPHQRTRRREAITAIRHVFLDADEAAPSVVAMIDTRRDLPPLSYVLHSSPNRAHLLWRVTAFTRDLVERLQKQLARELRTDQAATPCTQTTRLPGFLNHKRRAGHPVTIEYRCIDQVYTPDDFPTPIATTPSGSASGLRRTARIVGGLERARRYVDGLPPAIAGQHGDLHTFRVCCRLVRGFMLPDADALRLLAEWNTRCEPPWSERELFEKIRRARRYGREPIGGLLEAER